MSRAEDGEDLKEKGLLVGAGQERGRASRGGGVVHAQHAKPELGRGVWEPDCGELVGEEHRRRGGAKLEGGDEARGVAAVAARTDGYVNRRRARCGCRAKGGGGVVILELGLGVREGTVAEGAGHPSVARGRALGV